MDNEDRKEATPSISTIQIDPEMIKDTPPKIHIVRSKRDIIVEDILFDNGEVKKGIRYFLDPDSLLSMGACEISIGNDQIVKEHDNKNPMAGFNQGLPTPYEIPKGAETPDIPAAPSQSDDEYDPNAEKSEEVNKEGA